MNTSLSVKQVSLSRKITRVNLIFKEKGNLYLALNYRSIAVIRIVYKIMGKVLFKHKYIYMRGTNLLSKFQTGFQLLIRLLKCILKLSVIMIMGGM